MKAILYSNYGSPDVEDIEKPTTGDDEVLIHDLTKYLMLMVIESSAEFKKHNSEERD